MRILFIFLLSATFAHAQDFASIARESAEITDIRLSREVATDIMLRPADWNISASKYAVRPGDRLILTGDRKEIEFHDLQGTAEKPILITALTPTKVGAKNPGGRVMMFSNCQYVRLTGDPDGNGSINIVINGGGQAVDFRDLSQHVEADHLDITTGYSGINVKTDPSCDPKTWRGNFVLDGVYLHHNRVSTKTGEGFYVNESHYHGVGAIQGGPCVNGATTAQEHEGRNVLIEDNVIVTSGADGIQVGAVITGTCVIRRNTVLKYGTANGWGQTAGIILNPGTIADVYDNKIDTGTGFAIQLQGPGGSVVRNNVILNAGSTDQGGGIMQVNYIPNGKVDQIYNNTFINTRRVGVEYYNSVEFRNNILNTLAGALFYKQGGSSGKITASGNIQLSGDPAALKLDPMYAPLATSTIPAGTGYADYVKPAPVVTKTASPALIEKEVTDGVVKYYLITENGYRKLLE